MQLLFNLLKEIKLQLVDLKHFEIHDILFDALFDFINELDHSVSFMFLLVYILNFLVTVEYSQSIVFNYHIKFNSTV